MRLEHLLDYTAEVAAPINVGNGPLGGRIVANVTGGEFKGPKLSGAVLPSGADWALVGPDGNGRLDVRLVFRTNNGAHIYVTYRARMEMNDALKQVLFEGKGETDFGDNYWISQIQFETGDERYAWLNNLMAAGEGKLAPGVASYRVFALQAG